MTSKIIAGAAMMVPAFVLHTYAYKEKNVSFKNTAIEVGFLWAKCVGVAVVVGIAYLGVFHVGLGVYDLSPDVCPRE